MASICFEVECEVEGAVMPSEPDVGIFGAWVDDLDLSSVSMVVAVRKPFAPQTTYKNIDLLDGLDVAARDQVIRNILAVYGEDAEQELLEDQ